MNRTMFNLNRRGVTLQIGKDASRKRFSIYLGVDGEPGIEMELGYPVARALSRVFDGSARKAVFFLHQDGE